MGFIKPLILLLSLFGCDSSSLENYHCRFPLSNYDLSSFDKMVQVSLKPSGRVVYTDYFREMPMVKTHDLENKIVTVYEDRTGRKYNPSYVYRFYQNFVVYQVDLSSGQTRFGYGYAYHDDIKAFERIYRKPYTEDNFKKINRNPEILKYIPEKEKEQEQHISFGFWSGDTYDCEGPLSHFKNRLIRFFLFFHYLTGGI